MSKFTSNLTSSYREEKFISVLDKGLSFIPTTTSIPLKLVNSSLKNLHRAISIKDFFRDHPDDYDPDDFDRKFLPPSDWLPPISGISNHTINSLIKTQSSTDKMVNPLTHPTTKGTIITIPHPRPNLSLEERHALKIIKGDTRIIIKPADKGGATVIMDAYLYHAEALRQLDNPKYYKPIQTPVFPQAATKINTIIGLLRAGAFISPKQAKFLRADPATAKIRRFYLLPKIHKSRATWPHPFMPAGRPIVSDCGSESYNICKYINYYIKPLTTLHSSYIKDSYQFIQKIRNKTINPRLLLVTGDITSLYTNMHIDRIVSSVASLFQKYPDNSRPDRYILELLHITLTHNDFEFAGKLFLQILGVAMGRSYAPSTADAYLLEFDYEAQHGSRFVIDLFSRFLDDIFLLFNGNLQDLKQYELFLNSLIPDIQVTLKAHSEIIDFLDVYIYKEYASNGECTLQTRTYFKPTDTHQLLHKQSHHPTHTFRAILRSQFIRFKRLSSTQEDFLAASQILTKTLRSRGYSLRFIKQIQHQVWFNYNNNNTNQQHNNTTNTNKILLPVVTYYDPIQAKLNKMWREELQKNEVLKTFNIIPSFRIHHNLKQILTKKRSADIPNMCFHRIPGLPPGHFCTIDCIEQHIMVA